MLEEVGLVEKVEDIYKFLELITLRRLPIEYSLAVTKFKEKIKKVLTKE